jgi:mRNA interferase MazF
MAITSQLRPNAGAADLWIAEWQDAGLLKPSAVKTVFASVEQRLVIRTLGRLGDADREALKTAIAGILG